MYIYSMYTNRIDPSKSNQNNRLIRKTPYLTGDPSIRNFLVWPVWISSGCWPNLLCYQVKSSFLIKKYNHFCCQPLLLTWPIARRITKLSIYTRTVFTSFLEGKVSCLHSFMTRRTSDKNGCYKNLVSKNIIYVSKRLFSNIIIVLVIVLFSNMFLYRINNKNKNS